MNQRNRHGEVPEDFYVEEQENGTFAVWKDGRPFSFFTNERMASAWASDAKRASPPPKSSHGVQT